MNETLLDLRVGLLSSPFTYVNWSSAQGPWDLESPGNPVFHDAL